MSLEQLLADYSSSTLNTIVRLHGVPLPGKTKGEIARSIAAQWWRPKTIARSLFELNPPARRVLDRLHMHGGEARTEAFRRDLLRAGLIEESPKAHPRYRGDYRNADSCYFEDIIARLTAAGLVLSRGAPHRFATVELGVPGQQLLIPDCVRAQLPDSTGLRPAPPDVAVTQAEQAAPRAFQRDLYLYCRFVQRNEVALTNRGLVPKRQLAKLVEGLAVRENVEDVAGEHELGRAYFLRRLLEDLELLRQEGQRLVPAPTTLAFLDLPLAERIRRCFAGWLRTKRWNELRRIPNLIVDVDRDAESVPERVLEARRFVASQLAELPPERWISFEHLWERASFANYDFLINRDETDHYYYRNPYNSRESVRGWSFGNLKDDETGWKTLEGGFIGNVICEPLRWIGLVSLGYRKGQGLAFRISDLGARMMRGEASEDAQAPGQVIVQPNFQIFAFDPVAEGVLARLDRFADLVRAEQAVEFRLTRESVYRAQQERMPVSEIIGFLEAASGREVPQNVRRTLEEWDSHHERIVVRRHVSVVHCATRDLLDDLLANEQLAGQIDRRLAPNLAIARDAGALATALLAADYLPAVGDVDATSCKAAVTVAPDGRVVFEQSWPNVHLWRHLAPIAEQRDGALWLTADAVGSARDRGMSVEQIIGRLAEVYLGPVPESLTDRIKAWANHWGTPTLGSVELLRVKNLDVLREMLADSTIGRLLRPYPPDGAVAIVRPEDVPALREALEVKGIRVAEEEPVAHR